MSSTRERLINAIGDNPSPVVASEKRPVGRPSLYKPEYCQKVIDLGKQGFSPAEMAADLDVDRVTLRDWAEKHEEFSSALTRAKNFEQSWWEKRGRESLGAKNFQSSVWSKSMTARFKDDYTERRELTGANGGAIQVETKALSVDDFDPDDLASLEFLVQKAIAKRDTGSDE